MALLLLGLLVLSCAAFTFTMAGLTLVRRLVSRGVGDGHNDVSAAIFGVGGTVYAVFLAFLVITVWSAHDTARNNVADEASQLGTLYRGTAAMDPSSGAQLRAIIRRYTHEVIEDEWPMQAQSGLASARARAAGLEMFRLFATIPSAARQTCADIDQLQLGLIAQIQADRNRRTLEAQEMVSPIIWAVALANGFLVIVMSLVLYADRDWPHAVMSSMLAASVAMLIYVVYVFDQPFRGRLALPADAFVHSLEVYDAVDRELARPAGAGAAPAQP